MKAALPILFVFIFSFASAQSPKDTSLRRFHIGTALASDQDIAELQLSELFRRDVIIYQYTLNSTLKYFLASSNSINISESIKSHYTNFNYGYEYPKNYPAQLIFAAGVEHSFFAKRKFNFLTGASLVYTYLPYTAEVPNYLYNPNVNSLGGGLNIGCRYNISSIFSFETNIQLLTYHEIDLVYKRFPDGVPVQRATGKFFSLELFYNFNLPKGK